MESVAFLFPGQGSQLVGMGQTLHRTEPAAREVFSQADDTLGFSLSALCFEGPIETLTDTINAQPAILTTSIAILRVIEQKTDVRPAYVAGHSLGEFTALVSAGALTFADAVKLVRDRGRLMKAAGDSTRGYDCGAGIDAQIDRHLWEPRARPASSPDCQRQLSGADRHFRCTAPWLGHGTGGEAGAKRTVPLQVSIASHSPLMTSAAAAFEPLVAQLDLSRRCP